LILVSARRTNEGRTRERSNWTMMIVERLVDKKRVIGLLKLLEEKKEGQV
jgi:hypothetical protein